MNVSKKGETVVGLVAVPAQILSNDSASLEALETVIEDGLATFVKVGSALMEIRDRRLYGQATFEDYCRVRWSGTYFEHRQNVDAYIREAAVGRIIESAGNDMSLPKRRQARELAPLLPEPEKLRKTWKEIRERAEAAERPVTAALVREVVEEKRDVFTGAAMSSKTDLWSTPQDLFDVLDDEFGFETDVCSSHENHKCPAYFTVAEDGLAQDWRGICWMNPPYGDVIKDWVKKAYEESVRGATVVCLVPARSDTRWFRDYGQYGEIRLIGGRLKFGGSANSAPFPSAVIVFSPNIEHKIFFWEWQ